jgi:hypothetical protein
MRERQARRKCNDGGRRVLNHGGYEPAAVVLGDTDRGPMVR